MYGPGGFAGSVGHAQSGEIWYTPCRGSMAAPPATKTHCRRIHPRQLAGVPTNSRDDVSKWLRLWILALWAHLLLAADAGVMVCLARGGDLHLAALLPGINAALGYVAHALITPVDGPSMAPQVTPESPPGVVGARLRRTGPGSSN